MRILFLGPPGAGKGTQCKKLAQEKHLPHLSSGDLLRDAVASGSPVGQAAKGYMEKGQLVPDHVLIDMFKERLSGKACSQGFILDGFPRNLAQAEALDSMLKEIKAPLDVVINLQLPDHLLTERITGRRTCPNKSCNEVYHITFHPAKDGKHCDKCGTELVQRSDDKEELVKERLKVYNDNTAPLIRYYDDALILRTVDANGNENDIFADLIKTLSSVSVKA
ncbi:MAG TPA: adenylate kinase [Planktothrix sp.]|jgi:adenylate kinase